MAANTGAGPDIIVGWAEDPHIYADKLLDMTDIATYLGKKYGGWLVPRREVRQEGPRQQWIGLPMGGPAARCVYRMSGRRRRATTSIPTDHAGFLKLCQDLKKINKPAGFALGNAVGDGNGYCNWMLWSHGGMAGRRGRQGRDQQQGDHEALRYVKELYQTFIPGTLSWDDINNNRAYAAGEIVRHAERRVDVLLAQERPATTAAVAEDTGMMRMPTGPAGKMAENVLLLNAMVFKHTRFPNAAKEYLRFMMEQEQYDPWLTGCGGYWSHPLAAYAKSEVWTSDPKLAVYRDTNTVEFWSGYKGPIGAASGSVAADYVRRADVRRRLLRPVHARGSGQRGRAPHAALLPLPQGRRGSPRGAARLRRKGPMSETTTAAVPWTRSAARRAALARLLDNKPSSSSSAFCRRSGCCWSSSPTRSASASGSPSPTPISAAAASSSASITSSPSGTTASSGAPSSTRSSTPPWRRF